MLTPKQNEKNVMKKLRNLKIPNKGNTSTIVIRINKNILSFDFDISSKANEVIIFEIFQPIKTLNIIHNVLKIYSVENIKNKFMYRLQHKLIKNVYNCIDLLLQINNCTVLIRK